MKTSELRESYLSFFEKRDHRIIPASSLIPRNDPTLLFTNSGMVQFKEPLLGKEDPGYKRATSAQSCVRAGGKHNDLENVGYTARHHTFFEMMGNFSFGDYFKEETITWAWEFIKEVMDLPTDKLWITVHPDDDQSRKIWREKIGIKQDRIIDIKDNFWTMGETGPCGPNTEIFYDHGEDVFGGPPGSLDEDGDRFVEFWNLVFPQYDLALDGSLSDLPQFGVDTGMGLERGAAIIQGVKSNYEIDLFSRLMLAAGERAGITDRQQVLATPSLRVIADHIRSSVFLIADGVMPGNDGASYVLRRIIRRGLRHGYKLDINESFFYQLAEVVIDEMGSAYPTISEKKAEVSAILSQEEDRFSETLRQGMELLKKAVDQVKGKKLPGDIAFKLYDTYGFPVDLTADVIREQGMRVDMDEFDVCMEAQRERGRAVSSFTSTLGQKITVKEPVEFTGYENTSAKTEILSIFDLEGNKVEQLDEKQNGIVVLRKTPFYAESGGQIGDSGAISSTEGSFDVTDTQVSGDQHLHIGRVESGFIKASDPVTVDIDAAKRKLLRSNHSATHLMHAALRKILGPHVEQKGSLVSEDKLRFDFSHNGTITAEDIGLIEEMVNSEVMSNTEVITEIMSPEQAADKGAMALFGEKYGSSARVLSMGNGYSIELCGGTHVERTGDIGVFKIVHESGISAGTRRIEAVTGLAALKDIRLNESYLEQSVHLVRTPKQELVTRISQLISELKVKDKEIEALAGKVIAEESSELSGQAVEIAGIPFLASIVNGDNKAMMKTLDDLRSKLSGSIIVLAQQGEDKISLVVGIDGGLSKTIPAGEVLSQIGAIVGVQGGGPPHLARGGGAGDLTRFNDAVIHVKQWIEEQI